MQSVLIQIAGVSCYALSTGICAYASMCFTSSVFVFTCDFDFYHAHIISLSYMFAIAHTHTHSPSHIIAHPFVVASLLCFIHRFIEPQHLLHMYVWRLFLCVCACVCLCLHSPLWARCCCLPLKFKLYHIKCVKIITKVLSTL